MFRLQKMTPMFRLHSTLQHRFSINDTNVQASGSPTRENCAVSNGWEIRLPPMTTIHSNDNYVSKKLAHHTLFKGGFDPNEVAESSGFPKSKTPDCSTPSDPSTKETHHHLPNRQVNKNGGGCKKRSFRKHEGCAKWAVRGGVCIEYGAKEEKNPCSHEGCTNQARKGGFCVAHGTKVKGCRHVVKRGVYKNSNASDHLSHHDSLIIERYYSDHAADPTLDPNLIKYKAKGGVIVPFPFKLHEILDKVESDGLANIVSWASHGRCFCVHKPKEFVNHIMPHYFKKQTKWASFCRQLNLYGFRRLTGGLDKGGYYHELFLRGKVSLAYGIHRMRVKGTGVRLPTNPDNEPNFYDLPPITKNMLPMIASHARRGGVCVAHGAKVKGCRHVVKGGVYKNSNASDHLSHHDSLIIERYYSDHAADPTLDPNLIKYKAKGGVIVPFPFKLHEILDKVESDGLANIVSWASHGRCFCVHKPKEFVNHIMPHYFKKQTKWASFCRQLNLYGFRRLTGGLDKGGYYHELFLRGKVSLAYGIHRMRVKGTGVRLPTNPDNEPNFYDLPPITKDTLPMIASHGAERKLCSHVGCKNKEFVGGVCWSHGAKKRCSHQGCTNYSQRAGVCKSHGTKAVILCSHEGCTYYAHKEGVCKRHIKKSLIDAPGEVKLLPQSAEGYEVTTESAVAGRGGGVEVQYPSDDECETTG